ncbi:MAG: hypothetical protein R6U96_11345 [Promethearchaeia archaeon]
MIDEEDDEDVLEKGISWKSVLKNLLVIVLIMIGAFIIYFGGEENQMTNWMIGFTFICMGSTLMQVKKEPDKPLRQTLTILVCNLCGLTKVRNYEHGDYVFQDADDNCEKCNEPMEIKQVYSVKLKKPTEKPEESKEEQSVEKA